MNEIDYLTWFGYLASLVTAISLLMSRPLRLRWLNLVGSALFSVYGLLIESYPVAVFNGLIVFIDAYYIYRIYVSASSFSTILIGNGDGVLSVFLERYAVDMNKFFPGYKSELQKYNFVALQLRDMEVCGVVAGNRSGGELTIDIDYTSPNNRDYKPGNYLYKTSSFLKDNGITKIWAAPKTQVHQEYLVKMGFGLDSGKFSLRVPA
jgi:hypothetical protein